MSNPAEIPPPPSMRLMQCITGHWVTAAVYVTAKLGLADQLRDGPKTTEQIATQVGADAPSIYRVMRALASLGIFQEVEPKRFALTETGQLLRADHPQSLRSMALFQGSPAHWKSWGSLLHSAKTGEPAFDHVNGSPFFDYCQANPEFGAAFNGAMTGMSASAAEAVANAYDFSGIRKLVDVGGGHGYLLSRILEKNAHLQGAVFDLPQVVEGAKPALAAAGLSRRCEVIGGSFFEDLPPADAYIAKHIIHDWSDEHSVKILTNMREAMIGNGKVLLVELVLSADDREAFGVLIDLEMLQATHGGRERTVAEFGALFEQAGLKLSRVIPTQSVSKIIEAVPAT